MRKASPSTDSSQTWAELLNVDYRDPASADFEIVRRIGYLHRRARALRSAIEKHPRANMSRYETHLKRVEIIFSAKHVGWPWKEILDRLPVETVTAVGYMADLLDDDDWPSDEVVAELRDQVDKLLKDLLDSKLPADVLEFFVGQVTAMRDALDEYASRGPEAFTAAAERAAQAWVHCAHDVADFKQDEIATRTRALWRKIIRVATTVTTVGTLAAMVYGIPGVKEELTALTAAAASASSDQRRLPPAPTPIASADATVAIGRSESADDEVDDQSSAD